MRYAANDNTGKAISLLKEAVELIETSRSTLFGERSRIGFLKDKEDVYWVLVNALVKQGSYGEALAYTERAKSRAFVEMLATKQSFALHERSSFSSSRPQSSTNHTATSSAIKTSSPEIASLTRSIDRGALIKKSKASIEADTHIDSLVTVKPLSGKQLTKHLYFLVSWSESLNYFSHALL